MKLNKEGKIKLRKLIDQTIEQLKPDIHKKCKETGCDFSELLLHFDEETLDNYLFDEHITTIDGKRVIYKTFGSTSINLQYIDLSKVSFEDVSFDYEKIDENVNNNVNLQFTNAKIDFSKTYEYKHQKELILTNVNFRGVDLSNNDFEKLTSEKEGYISKCDLADTKIKFTKFNLKCIYTEFDNTDFSEATLSAKEILKNYSACSFFKTGLKINSDAEGDTIALALATKGTDCFAGCYLNGILFLSFKEKEEMKEKMKEEYNDMLYSMIIKTRDSLIEQVHGKSKIPIPDIADFPKPPKKMKLENTKKQEMGEE